MDKSALSMDFMLLKNCKILKNGKFEKVDILIKDNKIEKISKNIDIKDENTIDIKNKIIGQKNCKICSRNG